MYEGGEAIGLFAVAPHEGAWIEMAFFSAT